MKCLQQYSGSFLLALFLHIGMMSLFIVSALFQEEAEEKVVQKTPEMIEAAILDDAQVTAKAAELRQAEENKQRAQKHQQDKIAEQLKQEKRRLQQAKAQRLNEERKARAYAAQQKKKAQQAAAKLKAIQQQAALAKKKQALEKKRLQEIERLAVAKRKAEAEKKEAEHKAAEKQRQLAAQKKAVADRLRAEKARITRKATADAKALIHRKVTQNWNQPNSVAEKLACTIKVGLIPSGDVMTVQVIKSSGNALFDNSAERAVYKASPLPVPKDPDVFKQFRSFTFVFSPSQ